MGNLTRHRGICPYLYSWPFLCGSGPEFVPTGVVWWQILVAKGIQISLELGQQLKWLLPSGPKTLGKRGPSTTILRYQLRGDSRSLLSVLRCQGVPWTEEGGHLTWVQIWNWPPASAVWDVLKPNCWAAGLGPLSLLYGLPKAKSSNMA